MKYLFFVCCLLLSIAAESKQCHLSYDENQTIFVDCRIGTVPPNYKRVCPMVDDERDASVYSVSIVEIPDGFLGNLMDLVGLGNSRPWSQGAVIADNEKIVCEIDPVKVQARADAQAARQAAELAKKQSAQARKQAAETMCANQPDASPLKVLCEAVLDKEL